jgi:acyl-CoA-binding protein
MWIYEWRLTMSLDERFENAVKNSRSLPNQSNDNLLKMYALYKQATSGDVTGKRPGGFDFKGAAKYDAWAKLQGTSADDAKTQYADLVESLAK